MKIDLAGVEGRTRARDGGVETGGADSGETGSVMEGERKQESRTGINASLILDFRDKEESNKMCLPGISICSWCSLPWKSAIHGEYSFIVPGAVMVLLFINSAIFLSKLVAFSLNSCSSNMDVHI